MANPENPFEKPPAAGANTPEKPENIAEKIVTPENLKKAEERLVESTEWFKNPEVDEVVAGANSDAEAVMKGSEGSENKGEFNEKEVVAAIQSLVPNEKWADASMSSQSDNGELLFLKLKPIGSSSSYAFILKGDRVQNSDSTETAIERTDYDADGNVEYAEPLAYHSNGAWVKQ